MLVRAQDAVVAALEQDLAGLGSDRFEMPGRYALPGYLRHLPAIEPVEDFLKRRVAVLQVVGAGLLKDPAAAVEVVGPRFGPDDRVATVDESVPGLPRDTLLPDVAR